MNDDVRFDVIEPGSGGRESFEDEGMALEAAESWGKGDGLPWLQVVRVEGNVRVCVVAEHNLHRSAG